MEGHADGRCGGPFAGTGIGGRGLSAEERRAARRPDRDHAAELQFPAPVSPLAALLAAVAIADAAAARPAARVRAVRRRSGESTTTTPAMQFAKGYVGARWLASDPNGDTMIYTVEIRGANETEWKPLKEKVAEKYFSWDSTAFPGWRIPPADHGLRRARQSARGSADRALESDAVHHRQHAAEDHRPHRRAQRRKARRFAGTPPTR